VCVRARREDVDVAVTKWEEVGEYQLRVSWRFKCFIKAPWRPVLAAAGAKPSVPPLLALVAGMSVSSA
jgi:hypothetical protein